MLKLLRRAASDVQSLRCWERPCNHMLGARNWSLRGLEAKRVLARQHTDFGLGIIMMTTVELERSGQIFSFGL